MVIFDYLRVLREGLKTRSIMRDQRTKQMVIAFKRYRNDSHELFSFAIIAGTNIEGDFSYYIVQV